MNTTVVLATIDPETNPLGWFFGGLFYALTCTVFLAAILTAVLNWLLFGRANLGQLRIVLNVFAYLVIFALLFGLENIGFVLQRLAVSPFPTDWAPWTFTQANFADQTTGLYSIVHAIFYLLFSTVIAPAWIAGLITLLIGARLEMGKSGATVVFVLLYMFLFSFWFGWSNVALVIAHAFSSPLPSDWAWWTPAASIGSPTTPITPSGQPTPTPSNGGQLQPGQ